MTTNVTGMIRRVLGWCPQKENDFFQEQNKSLINSTSLNLDADRKSGSFFNEIYLPLDYPDWRKLAIILVLGFLVFILISVDYLNRTAASYFGIIIVYFSFIIFFNLSDHNKVSIDSEKLVIKTFFYESIKIQKNNIKNVKIIENLQYKYSWINLVLIILILLVGVIQALSLYREIMRSADLEDIVLRIANAMFFFFIMISIFYRSNRRSRYPKTMQIDSGNKKFTLYPRNGFEFNIFNYFDIFYIIFLNFYGFEEKRFYYDFFRINRHFIVI